MKKRLVILVLFFVLKIFANGGPIDGSVFYKTGDIVLMKYAEVKLLKEDLNIKIEGDYSWVTVQYMLTNTSSYNKEITYGFPVELLARSDWGEEKAPVSNMKFIINGKRVPFESQTDLSTFTSEVKGFSGEEVLIKRKWHVIDFSVEEDETVTLQVSYKVKNSFIDWATSKSFFENYDERKFIYDFRAAGKWGKGYVNTMNIVIDASTVTNNGGDIKIKGLDVVNDKGIYRFSSTNFDLKNSSSLYISYKNDSEKFSKYVLAHRIAKKHIKKVSVSSKLRGSYGKENLFDNDFKTAWVEGKKGAGIGEKIEIELDNYNLASICLINGYTKNKEVYTKNNRLKKVKLEVEIVDYEDETKTKKNSKEIEFEDKEFTEITPLNFLSLSEIVDDYGEGFYKMKKVTITILEVYRGTAYNDTCISELFLLGYK